MARTTYNIWLTSAACSPRGLTEIGLQPCRPLGPNGKGSSAGFKRDSGEHDVSASNGREKPSTARSFIPSSSPNLASIGVFDAESNTVQTGR
jgi:hypothetical protein